MAKVGAVETNKNYQLNMITIQTQFSKRISKTWYKFIPKQQWKWLKKQYVTAAACGCTSNNWIYLVEEDSCGKKLPAAVWVQGDRVIEEKKNWFHPQLSYWEERAAYNKDIHTPPDQRKRNTLWVDKNGFTKIGI